MGHGLQIIGLTGSLEPRIDRLAISEGRTSLRNTEDVLKLLLSATLGTVTTAQLVWNKKTSSYAWRGVAGSSSSQATTSWVFSDPRARLADSRSAGRFLEIGTAVKRLEMIIDTHSTT